MNTIVIEETMKWSTTSVSDEIVVNTEVGNTQILHNVFVAETTDPLILGDGIYGFPHGSFEFRPMKYENWK